MSAICQSCGGEGTGRCAECRRAICEDCPDNPCRLCAGTVYYSMGWWERPCTDCDGSGRPCELCGGSGMVLTRTGERVLDFLARHMVAGAIVRQDIGVGLGPRRMLTHHAQCRHFPTIAKWECHPDCPTPVSAPH